MKCQSLFSWKIKKSVIVLYSAYFANRMVKVKGIYSNVSVKRNKIHCENKIKYSGVYCIYLIELFHKTKQLLYHCFQTIGNERAISPSSVISRRLLAKEN